MATHMEKIQKLLEKFSQEVPGLIATGITDNETGMVIAGVIKDKSFDIENAGAHYTESYLKVAKATDILGGGQLKEILITSEKQFNLMTTLCNGRYHHGACVDSTQTMLGALRAISKLYHQEAEQLLSKL